MVHGQPHAIFGGFISISGGWMLLYKESVIGEYSPHVTMPKKQNKTKTKNSMSPFCSCWRHCVVTVQAKDGVFGLLQPYLSVRILAPLVAHDTSTDNMNVGSSMRSCDCRTRLSHPLHHPFPMADSVASSASLDSLFTWAFYLTYIFSIALGQFSSICSCSVI